MATRLLVIADSPTQSTGFGIVTENILTNLSAQEWDISVLAINYYGDAHPYQSKFKLFNPSAGGDVYGFARLNEMLQGIQPELIFIINDVWLVAEYIRRIRKVLPHVPIVVYTPVDSPCIKPDYVEPLNAATHVICYTDWGMQELRNSGLTVQGSVIPHGVNPGLFSPLPRSQARQELFLGVEALTDKDPFIVLYLGRNQPRKRVDLYVWIMAKWLKQFPHEDVYFHYHGAPKGDLGWDIEYLAHIWGVGDRLIVTSKTLRADSGIPAEKMKYIYNAANVYLQVCANEGWSLPLHEAMACGVPCIVPEYSALAECPNGAVAYVPVDETPWMNPNNIDTMHRFINVQATVDMLERLYQDKVTRDDLGIAAHKHATQKKFLWKNIAAQFNQTFKNALRPQLQGMGEWQTISKKLAAK